jgi:DNA-directed RNA polymerase specialized sigma24 family protein
MQKPLATPTSTAPPLADPSSAELVERCLRGDAAAWRTLVERYARLVRSIPARQGFSPAEVDDVGQEVFLALAQNLHTIEDAERLPGWLVTTTRRICWRFQARRRSDQPLGSSPARRMTNAPHRVNWSAPLPHRKRRWSAGCVRKPCTRHWSNWATAAAN